MNAHIVFPYLVKELRQVRGLTQEQLAHELRVTFGTVNGWENGKHKPIPALASRLLEIATAAGVALQQTGASERQGTLRKKNWNRKKG